MRVMLLPASYPPVLGGVQTVTHALARHLLAHGHRVGVVTQRHPRTLPAREEIDGVAVGRMLWLYPSVGHLRRGRLDLFLAALVLFPFNLFRLFRRVRAFRPEVINVHFPDAQTPYVRWLRRGGRWRLVVSLHGDEVRRFARTNEGLARFRALLADADAVTACSASLLAEAEALAPDMIPHRQVIPNGIDPARFVGAVPHAHPRPYVFAFGRLVGKKGFDLLIEAVAGMDGAPFDVLLAGDGPARGGLEAQATAQGLGERVHFLGRVTPEAVVSLLAGCAVAVVPSRAESFGIAALEALAAGRPLVATAVGGMADFLAPYAGAERGVFLVPPTAAGLRDGITAALGCVPHPETATAVRASFDEARLLARYLGVLAPVSA